MKSVALIGVAASILTGCAPVFQLIQPQEKAFLVVNELTVKVDNTAVNEAIVGSKGDGVALVVSGLNITPLDDKRCVILSGTNQALTSKFFCAIGDVPAKASLTVTFRAADALKTSVIIDASAVGYRNSQPKKPVVLWR